MNTPLCPALIAARMTAFPASNPLNLTHTECIGSRCVKWVKLALDPGVGRCADNLDRAAFTDPTGGEHRREGGE
jgi:hypothetical protein